MLEKYDKQHRKNLSDRGKRVQEIIDAARRKAVSIAIGMGYDGDGDFYYGNKLDDLMEETRDKLVANITGGIKDGWALSAAKASVVVAYVGDHVKLSSEKAKEWTDKMEDALDGFIARKVPTERLSTHKVSEMNLSERVWNLSGQFKEELELAVEAGMEKGMSASDLSRRVRRYLKDPDRLFRRVRQIVVDKNGKRTRTGELRLSKAAQAYHPGAGVYRSSYMNALRMTATEINTAYRTADYLRWRGMPFVLGIEIRITDTHRHEPDICDDLKGRYPKDFKFTGWHPWCRCYAVPILPSVGELSSFDEEHPKGDVKDVPEAFTKWVEKNEERISRAKKMPGFLKENRKYWDAKKGNAEANASKAMPVSSVKQVKDYTTIKAYENGGRVYVHNLVSDKDSDYKKLVEVADFFAKQGKEVSLTPKKQRTATFNYDSIYGSLKGTKYYGKCPDMRIGDLWYEHEGFVSSNYKRAFRNMITHGLKQSDRIVIDDPKLSDGYMLRSIYGHIKQGKDISEVWIKDGKNLRLLYKNRQ